MTHLSQHLPRASSLTKRGWYLLSLLAVLASGSSIWAQEVDFVNPTPDADWFTGTNWSTGVVPAAGDTAVIDLGYSALLSGGASSIDTLNLGGQFSTLGFLTVSGTGSSLNVSNQLIVGFGNEDGSSLVVQSGATVAADGVTVGFGTTAGNLTVTGPGSTFTTGPDFGAMEVGAATITVSNGGQLNTAAGFSTGYFGGTSVISVTGTGSTLSAGAVNLHGGGSLTIDHGGTVLTSDDVSFGGTHGVTVTVDGPGSSFITTDTVNGFFNVGESGTATLIISNGGTATGGFGAIAQTFASDVGSIIVTGTNSTLGLYSLSVGYVGTGTMLVADGAKVIIGEGQSAIAKQKGSVGAVTITGTGSLWDAGQGLTVGSGSNSVGTLNILDGATLNASVGGLSLASSTNSTGTIIQSSGLVNAVNLGFGKGKSTYSLQGGVLQVGGGNGINVSTTGTYTLDLAGGTIQVVSSNLTTSATATLHAGTTSTFDSGTFTNTWSGVVTGTGGLNKIGAGNLTLSGANTYQGGTTLSSGTITAGSNTALGTGTMTFAGASTLQTVTATRTLTNSMVINNGVTGTIGGTLALGLSGTISGSGALAKVGTGTLVLTGNNTYTGGTTISAGLINFSSTNNFGTNSGPINLTGGGLQWATGNTTDMSSRIALGAGGGTIDTNGNSLTFASSATGAGGLTKAGTGTLTLSASNAYTGNTTVTAGTLRLANQNAIVNSGTLVLNGGTLRGNGTAYTLANAVSLAASSTIDGATDLTFTGNVGLGSTSRTLTVTNTGTTLFSGTLAGTAGFTKAGAGVLSLSGANTYTGGTTISAGTLSFAAGSLSTGAVTVNGGELRWAAGNTNTLANNIGLGGGALNTNGNNVNFTGTLTGSGTLTKKGEGILTLSATASSSSAGTSVLGGTLRLGTNGALASSKPMIISAVTDSGTATLDLNGFNLTVSQLLFNGTTASTTANRNMNNLMTGSGTLTLAGNVSYLFGSGDDSTDPQTSTVSGHVALGSANRTFFIQNSAQATGPEFQVDAVVSGAGGVLKSGGGRMAMAAANTYTGSTTIFSGILSVTTLADGGQASGIGASSSANSNLILQSGTLQYTGTGGSTNRLFMVGDASTGGSGAIDASGSGAIAFTNTGTFSSFPNRSAVLILTGTNTGANTLAGAFIDNVFSSNSLEKDGTGTWILTGSSNYQGGTTLNAGTLGLGSANAISGTGTIAMNGGTLQFSASNTTDYSARFSTGTSQQYNIDTNGQSVTFASNLTSVGGTLGKYGAGTLTLSGSNSYNGGTTVSSGTLVAASNNAVGTGAVTINGGVYLIQTGVTSTNSVTVASGTFAQSFSSGASLVNAVNATSSTPGGVTTNAQVLAGTTAGATTLQTSFSATSGALNDQYRLSDVYSFHGTGTDIFTLQLSFTSTAPGSYIGWLNTSNNLWVNAIEGNTGNDALAEQMGYNGSFAAFQALYGTDLSLYLGAWGYTITGGTTTTWAVLDHNSDFAVVPEPGTCALVVIGLGSVLIFRRKRP